MLKSEQPLLLSATVRIEDGENPVPKVNVREICPLKQASQQKTSRVHFYLPADDLSQELLERLRAILRRHKGKCVAFLLIRLPDAGPEIVLKLPDRVSYSEKVETEVDSLFQARVTEYS